MKKNKTNSAKNILFYGFVALICLTFSGITVAAATGTLSKKTTVVRTIKLPIVPALAAKQAGSAVVLKWGKPARGVSFANYTIYRSEQSGKLGTAIASPAKTILTYTDKKVLAGKTYFYSIKYAGKNTIAPNGRQIKIKITPSKAAPTITETKTAEPSFSTSTLNEPVPITAKEPDIFSNGNPIVPPIKDVSVTAADNERIVTLKQLQIALAAYFAATGTYPEGTELTLGLDETSCLNTDGWGMDTDCPYPYFGKIPKDPGAGAYVYNSTGDYYTITNTLDGKVLGLSGNIVLTPIGFEKRK